MPKAEDSYETTERESPDFAKAVESTFIIDIDFQTMIILLLGVVLIAAGVWFIRRTRKRRRDSSMEYLILESEISIEIGDEGLEIEYEDEEADGRMSMEMILNSAPPQRLTFDIDNLPTFHIDRRSGNILERRGRKTLKLQPPQSGDADMAILDIKEGRLTVSPFSSRKDPAKVAAEFPRTRRRILNVGALDSATQAGISTAPYLLQSNWRPLDTDELPKESQ